jgi:hypothetical protein
MLARGRIPVLEAPYLQDLDAESLKPGEEPVQGGLITQRAVQDGFDRLTASVEPVEVEQSFRREDSSYPDLIIRRWHRGAPSRSEFGRGQLPRSRFTARCTPLTTDEFVTLVRLRRG